MIRSMISRLPFPFASITLPRLRGKRLPLLHHIAPPLVRAERDHLRRSTYPLLNVNYLALFVLFALGLGCAYLPFLIYFTVDQTRLLAASAVVITVCHVMITLRAVLLAVNVASVAPYAAHQHDLRAQGLDIRHIIWSKWWAVMRHMVVWVILLAIMKFGLALSLAQHIHSSHLLAECQSPFEFVCQKQVDPVYYFPATNQGYRYDPYHVIAHQYYETPPATWRLWTAAGSTLIFSLLHIGLVAAVGLAAPRLVRHFRFTGQTLGIACYGGVIGLILFILVAGDSYVVNNRKFPPYEDRCDTAELQATGLAALSPLVDGGTLIGAQWLRPVEPSDFETLKVAVSALLGFGLTVGAIGGLLWYHQRDAIQQYALVPPRRPRFDLSNLRQTFINPVMRAQTHRLRPHARTQWFDVRRLAWITLAMSAFIWPRVMYFDNAHGPSLLVFVGIVALIRLILWSYTLILTTRSLHRETASNTWDLLALTPLNARQVIFGKWWAILRHVWFYYALLAVAQLALAYAITEYLSNLNDLYNYTIKHNLITLTAPIKPATVWSMRGQTVYPAFDSILHAGIILIALNLAEAAFMVALGIFSALTTRRNLGVQIAFALGWRFLLIGISVVFIWLNVTQLLPDFPYGTAARRSLELLQMTATTQIDSGVLVGADSMRTETMRDFELARRLAPAPLGIGLFSGWTLLTLWLAQRQAIRRGAIPPPPLIQRVPQ